MKQSQALDILKMGHNVFLTGPPGAGKTYVLNDFIDYLNNHQIPVGITASTGIAATHIGGMTIHSWSGIGIREELTDETLEKLASKSPLVKRLTNTKVLIIDEISMLHGKRLDLVNQVCKHLKKSDKPFGGMQVVLTGDLFQLPPVTRNRGTAEVDFVFKGKAWQELKLKVCYLEEQHRQNDNDLLSILNKIRTNTAGLDEIDLLQTRQIDEQETNATRLYTHNADVDSINEHRLRELNEDEVLFTGITKGRASAVETLVTTCLAPENLVLKLGAEIMTVANNPAQHFVNGSRGTVVGFDEESEAPVIQLHNSRRRITLERNTWAVHEGDRIIAEFAQYPLRLAWAITVHKSQGMSLDEAEVDLGRSFEPGMGYVALSRVRSLDGLILRGINDMAMRVHPEIIEFDVLLQKNSIAVQSALEKLSQASVDDSHENLRAKLSPSEIMYDEALYQKLMLWRTKKAKSIKLPAYMVFDNKTLKSLASIKPKSEQALLSIKGVGNKKCDSYGHEIIDIITNHE